MRLDDVEELYAFMLEKRILVCEVEGVKLCLDPSALPMLKLPDPPPDSKVPGWDEDYEQETPMAKIRREFAEKHGIVGEEIIE